MKIEKRIFIIPRLSLRHIAIIKSGSGKNNPPTGGKLDGKRKSENLQKIYEIYFNECSFTRN